MFQAAGHLIESPGPKQGDAIISSDFATGYGYIDVNWIFFTRFVLNIYSNDIITSRIMVIAFIWNR